MKTALSLSRALLVTGAIAAVIFCAGLVHVAMAEEITDIEITAAVENQILRDPGTSLNDFDISTTLGIVTIGGAVDNILAKERAVKVAQTVKGVRSVIDDISVVPPLRPDGEIEEDIRQALIYDPLSESWDINVFVDNGNVTLTGESDSWAERELIGKITKGIRGVVSLDNNMVISYDTQRTAEEMKEEIERRLHWDALVDDSLVDVTVSGSKAILKGTVGSAAERIQAQRDSWVAGITEVDSRNLEVDWWARDTELRKKKYQVLDDKEVVQAIKDTFFYDPRVNMFNITVEADNGWVSLHGTVDNLQAKRSAAIDARNTVGVWNVKNFIKVRPDQPSDRLIADAVRNGLLMNPLVERQAIDVSVVNGEVYLSGTVDSFFEKAEADHIAAGISGVKQIHNQLIVRKNDIITHSPYIDPWYTYDYDWYVYPDYIPVKSDARIKEEINDELFWSPFVDSDEINVTVDEGLATLSGTVDSWFEYSAAVENALEGGAVGVDNELTVDNS